jgi:hypothetical protein
MRLIYIQKYGFKIKGWLVVNSWGLPPVNLLSRTIQKILSAVLSKRSNKQI